MSMPKNDLEDSRPPLRKEKKFSYFEPFAGIIFAIVATVIFLGFPQIITIVFIGGRLIPTLDEVVIQSLWLPIILWAVFRIGVEVAYLIERRYTPRLAVISLIGHVLTAIVTVIIFADSRIVYWEYVDFVHTYFENVAEWFGEVLAKPNLIILAIMMIVLIIESINVVKKGKRQKIRQAAKAENKD